MDCSPPSSSVHGIFQARTLEWVAISYFRRSSGPRDQTHISCVGRWILYHYIWIHTYKYTYIHTHRNSMTNSYLCRAIWPSLLKLKIHIFFDSTILLLGITIDVICKNIMYRDTLFYCALLYCTLQILLFFTNWRDQSNDNISEAWVWRSNSQEAVNHSGINTSCLGSNQTSH